MPLIPPQEPRGGGGRRAGIPALCFYQRLLPIHMTLRHINPTQAAWGSSVNGWEPSAFIAGDTARHTLYYPGTPQRGCSLTRGIQVRGQRGTTALLRGSISPLPAALLCRIPSSPHGLALCMGYAECGIVTRAGMLNLYLPPCHKKEEAQEMRWRSSPSSYFSSTPTAA